MKGPLLLCALVLLCVPRRSAVFYQPDDEMCHYWLYGKEPFAKAFQCLEWRDGTDVKICCGTCSPPCCCSSEGSLISHHWCPVEGNLLAPESVVEVSPFTKVMEHWMLFFTVSSAIILAFAVSFCIYFWISRVLFWRTVRKLREERRRQRALCRQRRGSAIPGFNDAVRGDAVRDDGAAAGGAAARDGVRRDTARGDGVRGDGDAACGAAARGDGGAARGDGVQGDGGAARGDGGAARGDGDAACGDAARGDAARFDVVREDAVPERSAAASAKGFPQGIQPAPDQLAPAVHYRRGSNEDVVTILPSAAEEAPSYKRTVGRRYNSSKYF